MFSVVPDRRFDVGYPVSQVYTVHLRVHWFRVVDGKIAAQIVNYAVEDRHE